jgi:hypothetical protein
MSDDKDRDEWIASHGSERLQLALRLGMADKSVGVYRDERLAVDLPGWQWANRDTKISEAINPSLAALRWLNTLRSAVQGIRLVKVQIPDGHGGEWREAIAFEEIPWAPGRVAFQLIDNDERKKP